MLPNILFNNGSYLRGGINLLYVIVRGLVCASACENGDCIVQNFNRTYMLLVLCYVVLACVSALTK